MKVMNAYTAYPIDRPRWERTSDGFLRCTARILKEGVMPYLRKELAEIPENITGDSVNVLIPLDVMKSAESLRSLEGMQVVVGDHSWVTPENVSHISHGNVAGTPRIDGPYIVCDMVITDQRAMTDIESGRYPEISAGYHADIQYVPGWFDGVEYQARQCNIKYNHIAVIPAGSGRAGEDVRIINKKQEGNMEKPVVKVKLRNGKFLNTDEDGANAVADDSKATDELMAKSNKSVEELMSDLDAAIKERDALQAKTDQLEGELSVWKEKMDQVIADAKNQVDEAAEELIEDRGTASEIIENNLIKGDDGKEIPEEEKAKIMNSLKGLRGVSLYQKTLEVIRMPVANMSPESLKGAFQACGQFAKMQMGTSKGKTVAGAKMMNSMTDFKATPERTDRQRLGLKD